MAETDETEAVSVPAPIGPLVEGGATVADLAWDSAFFRLAGCVRELSHGAVNYKLLYSLVGTKGRYINHGNATVRKRTAANLSRLMHSSRYVDDLQRRFADDPDVFRVAANELCARLTDREAVRSHALLDAFLDDIWAEMRQGLVNELIAGRRNLNLERVDQEHRILAAWCLARERDGLDPLAELVASYLHILAFGRLDERFAHALLMPTPLDDAAGGAEAAPASQEQGQASPFLARLIDKSSCAFSAIWHVDERCPFTIGRFTDCDAIDENPHASRLHCRIYFLEGAWWLEDASSRFGTRVLRDGEGTLRAVYDSKDDAGCLTFRLELGDVIEVARGTRYLFGLFMSPGGVTHDHQGRIRMMEER